MNTKGVAVISGAFGAAGTAIGKRLAQEGYSIAALYHSEPQISLAQTLATFGPGKHAAYRCDFGDPHALKSTLGEIIATYKKIDVGIHAAWPHINRTKLSESTEEAFEEQFHIGVRGSFVFLQTLGKNMHTQGSGILVGLTTAALEADTYPGAMGAYIPAKFALYGLLKTLSQELTPAVRVHAIAPRFMGVGINKDLPPRLVEFMRERNPKELTTPEQIADVIVQVLSVKESPFSLLA